MSEPVFFISECHTIIYFYVLQQKKLICNLQLTDVKFIKRVKGSIFFADIDIATTMNSSIRLL